ncbi:MAG: hypothetical protein LBD11_02500 [Candidatus Peribacteria bacterium]|jgi:hypothetical protein|nr:hypothetical protein [Candidatus Peribacteria bacterium]
MGDLATQKGKKFALAALKERRQNPPEQVNNSSLRAGSPMYYYCNTCGHLSDVLPEAHIGSPKRWCKECQALKDEGWLV